MDMTETQPPEADLAGLTHVPRDRWGRDHWTTLLYLETACVDGHGYPDDRRMRDRDPKYPCRLNDGTVVSMHSDWDCVDDMVAEGMVEYLPIPTAAPARAFYRIRLTDAGWTEAGRLRRARAEAHHD